MKHDRAYMDRLRASRTRLLARWPFYGTLAMRLDLGLSPMGTACTDMRRILFDPSFMDRLSDEALDFVFCHEVMHCVLSHCVRSKGKDPLLYNIAADIVVNSVILGSMGLTDLDVDGETPMHLAPDGREGRLMTAEEGYEALRKLSSPRKKALLAAAEGKGMDDHGIWEEIPEEEAAALSDAWKEGLKEARARFPGSGSPGRLRDVEMDPDRPARLRWPTLLQKFYRLCLSERDYSYLPPDPRYEGLSDYFFPSFPEAEDYQVRTIFVAIDTSASIDDDSLRFMLEELRGGMAQLPAMRCLVSFFDGKITDPVLLSDCRQVPDLKPEGGGGTDFFQIFETLKDLTGKQDLCGLVVLTDGYARFPEESAALGLPVLWVIVDSEVEPPFGTRAHVRLSD